MSSSPQQWRLQRSMGSPSPNCPLFSCLCIPPLTILRPIKRWTRRSLPSALRSNSALALSLPHHGMTGRWRVCAFLFPEFCFSPLKPLLDLCYVCGFVEFTLQASAWHPDKIDHTWHFPTSIHCLTFAFLLLQFLFPFYDWKKLFIRPCISTFLLSETLLNIPR